MEMKSVREIIYIILDDRLYKELEDIKGVIRIRKSKENRQYNCQKKQRTNNDVQSTTQKTKDRAIRTSLKTMGELGCTRRVSSS